MARHEDRAVTDAPGSHARRRMLRFIPPLVLASLIVALTTNSLRTPEPISVALLVDAGPSAPVQSQGQTNIMDFGAAGDGVTSDHDAWDLAVAATPAGGTLFLPPGYSYALPEPVVITKPLNISGHDTTLVKPAHSGQVAIWFSVRSDDVTMEGLTFSDPHNLVRSTVLNFAEGTSNGTVRESVFNAVDAIAVRVVTGRAITVAQNDFDGVRSGVHVAGASQGVEVTDNTIMHWRDHGIHIYGTAAGSPSNVDVIGNTVKHLTSGGYPRYPIHTAQGSAARRLQDLRVMDNVVIGPGRSYVAAEPGTADQISLHQVNGLLVRDNVSHDGGDMAITVESSADVVVAGNMASGADASGIAIFTDVTGASVFANTAVDNGRNREGNRPAAARAGIRVSTSGGPGPDGVLISENLTGNTTLRGSQLYGISVGSAAAGVVTTTNRDTGNAIGLLLDQSSAVGTPDP